MKRNCMRSTAVAFIALLFAACGGSESQDTPTPSPASAQPTAAATVAAEDVQPDSPAAESGMTVITLLGGSEALYRINEQLVRRDLPNDAVGTTSDIEGQIV